MIKKLVGGHVFLDGVFADEPLYMENGRVLESGSHRELVEKNGKYMALLQSR